MGKFQEKTTLFNAHPMKGHRRTNRRCPFFMESLAIKQSEDGIYHNELSIPSNVVDECGEQVSITMNEGTLQITGAKKAIALYDANGRLIRKIGSVERTEETTCIPLTNAGVYLLTIDQSQYKIVAK